MSLAQYQIDELYKLLDRNQKSPIAFQFPGKSGGSLYGNWVPFYLWKVDTSSQELEVSIVPYADREIVDGKPFIFKGNQFEDCRVIKDDLLINIDPSDRRIINAFRRAIRLESMVRYRWEDSSKEHYAVGRAYGVHSESRKKYLNMGVVPSERLSINIPKVLVKNREAVVGRRRELIGRKFGLDSIVKLPIERKKFSFDVILIERKKKE